MTTFLALYRGQSIARAELVAVSSNRDIVSDFASKLIDEPQPEPERKDSHLYPEHRHTKETV